MNGSIQDCHNISQDAYLQGGMVARKEREDPSMPIPATVASTSVVFLARLLPALRAEVVEMVGVAVVVEAEVGDAVLRGWHPGVAAVALDPGLFGNLLAGGALPVAAAAVSARA